MTPHIRPARVEPGPVDLAAFAAETIRDLNHLTRFHDALNDPAELSQLLAELTATASGLPQLLNQLNRWLSDQHHAARLQADTETDLNQLVSSAATQLAQGGHAAHHLAAALDTAHQHLAQLATAKPDRRNC